MPPAQRAKAGKRGPRSALVVRPAQHGLGMGEHDVAAGTGEIDKGANHAGEQDALEGQDQRGAMRAGHIVRIDPMAHNAISTVLNWPRSNSRSPVAMR